MRAVHLFIMDTEAQPTPWGLEPLIDVGELATYLGIPVSTIYDWGLPAKTCGYGWACHGLPAHPDRVQRPSSALIPVS